MRQLAGGRVVLGGHSYGGRQSSMLAAEDPTVADVLLLISYPLHTTLFVHGTKDPFGSIEEMRAAIKLFRGLVALSEVPAAAHDLAGGKFDITNLVLKPLYNLLT
jgi:predicted alpha/beta-hydrolase family hydrolase